MTNELSETDLGTLLEPFLQEGASTPAGLYTKLTKYLQLLQKWNARTNLSAIRDPVEIVTRHFGESIFAAQNLGDCETLLDFGSGAGFPGLPIQLMRDDICVTVAESQNKKASFLREVVRTLGLSTTVWGNRVEAMPESVRFDVVTLRAVDNMGAAIAAASIRAGKSIMLLSTLQPSAVDVAGFTGAEPIFVPGGKDRVLISLTRSK